MKPTADLLLRGNRASKTRRFKGWQDLVSRLVWAGFNPMSFTGAGYAAPTAQQAADGQMGAYTPASGDVMQQYMTPYLQGALQPQYDAGA